MIYLAGFIEGRSGAPFTLPCYHLLPKPGNFQQIRGQGLDAR